MTSLWAANSAPFLGAPQPSIRSAGIAEERRSRVLAIGPASRAALAAPAQLRSVGEVVRHVERAAHFVKADSDASVFRIEHVVVVPASGPLVEHQLEHHRDLLLPAG